MLPRKKRHLLYAQFLLILSVVCTTALANTKVFTFITGVAIAIEESLPLSDKKSESSSSSSPSDAIQKYRLKSNTSFFLPPTTVLGADNEQNCGVDGSLVAEVFVCGDYDFKDLSIAGNPSGAIWEQYIPTGACAQDFGEVCPSFLVAGTNCSNSPGNWTQVATGATYTIDPSNVPVSSGTEYRVRNAGNTYYIKATKSAFTYNYEVNDVVCGTLGSIRINALSPAYELRIASGSGGFGPWQNSREFLGLAAGNYTVEVRLGGTPNACEYPYPPFTIADRSLDIAVTVTDATCPGQNGDVFVQLNGAEVPGPYTYTLINAVTNQPIVFTPGIAADSYTFSSVSPGTYIVQVETPECQNDFANGISAPTQNQDTGGNPIVIGAGLQTIVADANLNGQSFGCASITTVDIDITTVGGTPPYTYTVSSISSGSGTSPAPYTDSETSVYSVTASDTYTFTITDANGCSPDSPLSVYIDNLPPPSIDPEPILGTCTNGGGKINFQVVNNPGYDLEYRVTSGDPWVNSNIVNVPDGTYNDMWVRYTQGVFSCEILIADTVVVTSDASITGSASVTSDFTCTAGGGTITFNPGMTAGGTGSGYEYSIDNVNYQIGTVFSGLAAGTYTPFIRDDSGCRQAIGVPLLINDPAIPTDITFAQANINCATGTSEVTVTVVGGATVSTYEIIAPAGAVTAPQASNVFPNLLLDTRHDFVVTDVNGCTHPASFVTGGVSTIRARVQDGGDRNVCSGASDGFGTFVIDGFSSDNPGLDYTYSISGTALSGSSSDLLIPVSGLGAGTYTITVTDADTNCTDTADLIISGPPSPLSVTPNFTPMSCSNGNVGSLEAIKVGGFSGQPQYQLTYPGGTIIPWKNGRFFGGLNETGTYTIEVRDTEGCIASNTFNLTSLGAPTISEGLVNRCFTSSSFASIVVFSAAGTGSINDHRFRILGQGLEPLGTPGTHTFANLVPGTYTIEVENIVTNCSATLAPITIEPEVQVTLDLVSAIECGGTGTFNINVTGGDVSNLSATNYTLYLDGTAIVGHQNVALTANPQPYIVPAGGQGTYTIDFTDNNGCATTAEPLVMDPPTNITAVALPTGPSCGDPNSGFVELIPIVSPGVPPFQFVFGPVGSLTGNVADPNFPDGDAFDGIVYSFSSQSVYSGLAAGTYEYIVIDDRNCPSALQTVVVVANTDPPPVVSASEIPAVCSPGAPAAGGIQINSITPGSPDYSIQIEDNFGNIFLRQEDFAPGDLPLTITDPSLIPGNYQVVVIDARGCIDIQPVTITSADLDIIPDPITPPVICTAGGETLCVEVVGGTAPENYEIRIVTNPISPWSPLNSPPDRHCFSNLLLGVSYTIEVRDANTGCTYQEVITLPDGPNIDVTLDADGATCRNGDVGVNYTINPSNAGTPPYDVTITNLDTGVVVYNVSGTFDLTLATDIAVPAGRYGVAVTDSGDCSAGAEGEAILDAPRVDIVSNINANCNASGLLTVRGSGGNPYPSSGAGSLPDGAPYEFAYVPAGTPIDEDGTATPFDPSDNFTTDTSVSLPGTPAPGTTYDIWVRDFNLCSYRISAAVIQEDPPLPAPMVTVNNQCDVSTPVGGFEITVEMPGTVDTPTFTLNGESQTPAYTPGVATQATFYVNSIGVYPIYVVDINGCFVYSSAEIFQVLSASADFTSTPPTCTDPDGEIVVTANGGSGDYDFELSGTDYLGTPITTVTQTNIPGNFDVTFSGIAPGTYQVRVIDNRVTGALGAPCEYLVDGIVSDAPTLPVIVDTGATDITCNNANDGSITVTLQPGTDVDGITEYSLYDSSNTLIVTNLPAPPLGPSNQFTGLGPDTYRVEVSTERGCFDAETVVIANPDPFAILIPSPLPTFQCSPGSNQVSSATFTIQVDASNGNGGTPGDYRFRMDATGVSPTGSFGTSATFEVFDDGTTQTIVVEGIDARGCSSIISFDIAPPTDVTGTINQVTPMSCIQGEEIDVAVAMTIPEDYIIRANSNSVATFPDSPLISAGTTNYSIILPEVEGDYYLEIVAGGCIYPLEVYTVVPPIIPEIIIAEVTPETCFNAQDGIISIEITNYTGNDYTYWVYDANDPGFLSDDFTASTPLTGASGSVTGTVDIGTDGNPASINDLPSGNVRVVVRQDDAPNCLGYSNVITVGSPNPVGPLEVFNLVQDQTVGCSNDLGILSFEARYGWDTDPYEFQVRYRPTTADPWTIVQSYGPQQSMSNRPAGIYEVTVRDIYQCTGVLERELLAEPIVEVALNIERQLECPNGNDAILVAVDPNNISVEGAIGGVAGEQYLYQLIKLDSNHPDPMNQDPADPANREFEFGQQTSPRFEGNGGIGVIPEGYYAVLAEGPYGCFAYSPVIQVIPPQPINPQLRLVAAPACGDPGILELRVFNFEVGATYEYRAFGSADPWVTMTDQSGTAVNNIPGVIGVTYEFEVRKVGANGPCLERITNQVPVVDPLVLSIDSASPQSSPSCSSIDDGRIEIFATGGTGVYEYSLYLADPSAPTVRTALYRGPQTSANFENLPPNHYVAVVTSGSNCEEQAEFHLEPAIAVLITPTSQNVLCYGDATGSITMEVDPSYPGLVEFAIEPNFASLESDPANPLEYTFTDLPVKPDGSPYRVLAQDADGCPYFFDIPLTQPDQLQIIDLQTTPELCINANDGTVVFDIQGGTEFNDPMVSPTPYFEYKIEMISPTDETGTGTFVPYDGQAVQNLIGGATYELYVQDANGCPTSEVFTIDIGVDLSAEPLVQYGCEGIFPNSTSSIVLDNPSLLPDLLFYLEDLNSTNPPLTVQEMIDLADIQYTWGDLPASEYRVHIFHSNGCSITVELGEILAYEPLTLSTPEKTAPNEITITASGGYGDYEYFFQGESQGADNVYVSNQDMNVEIMVRDSMGCVVTASIPFDFTGMLEIPNFFTPDGDNNNDVWFPRNREFFPNIEVKIYDRYGRVVAILNQIESWDGTYEGNELPTGDYWYVVNQNDDRKTRYVGHFTLYR